jgi:two-component system sensor histidine kinase BaeS
MVKRSIRWRLALSFAGLALLVTLALGALLLGILRDYYGQQEQHYLMNNAIAIGGLLADIVLQNPSPAALQTQLEGLTFLSQSRIRLLDPDHNVLADSGPFTNINVLIVSAGDVGDQTLIYQLLDEPPSESENVSPRRFEVLMGGQTVIGVASSVMTSETPSTVQVAKLVLSDTAPLSDTMGTVSVAQTFYGFGLGADTSSLGSHSKTTFSQPIWQADGTLWGYVELSEGPAYGTQIVNNTMVAWGIAGALAVLMAAIVGWMMSRNLSAPLSALTTATTQMAAGDLSTRAPATARADEFGSLSRAFNQMADRVEETVFTLREFVSDAAHELHTPLTALHTNLELAGDTDVVVRARAQVTRLETLTEGLLDLSRIEAGTQTFSPVDMVVLAREMAELYASQAEQTDVAFTVDIGVASALVPGDETQLRRVLLNLLDNALKFTPAGGAVHFILTVVEHAIVICVADTGIGIPPEDLPHLFNRFHRGRNTAHYPGSGLGLAIVRAIVERHGGQVQAENSTDGACFTVRLPM